MIIASHKISTWYQSKGAQHCIIFQCLPWKLYGNLSICKLNTNNWNQKFGDIFGKCTCCLLFHSLYTHTNTQNIYVCVCVYMGFPWTARRSNQSILKKISPEYSSEGLMLKLKLQSFGYLMQRIDSLGKTLMLGRLKAGAEGDDMVGWHHRLNRHVSEQALGAGDGQGNLVFCSPWGRKELDMTERLNWTDGLSLVAQTVKHLPTTQETRIRSLAWKDPLGKEMAIHSSILAWKMPQTEEPRGLQSMNIYTCVCAYM